MELVEFLRARLDEDERAALAVEIPSGMSWFEWAHRFGFALMNVVRHDPQRVLTDVEAKRRIVDEHQRHEPYGDDIVVCSMCGPTEDEVFRIENYPQYSGGAWPCRTIRLLALPFAGHPDYDESWRP